MPTPTKTHTGCIASFLGIALLGCDYDDVADAKDDSAIAQGEFDEPRSEIAAIDEPRADQPPIYFGRVRNDVGSLFAVQNGSANYIDQRGWDDCPAGYYTIGKVFEKNGFWLCVPQGTTHRYWVGNVVMDHGYYYSFLPGYMATYEGEEHWNTCRTGSLLGTLFDSNGFWVCQE